MARPPKAGQAYLQERGRSQRAVFRRRTGNRVSLALCLRARPNSAIPECLSRTQRACGPPVGAAAPHCRILQIEWRETDNHVLMTGPARFSFAGETDLSALLQQ